MSRQKLHEYSEGGLHMALLIAVLLIFAGVLLKALFLDSEASQFLLGLFEAAVNSRSG
ncbi:hypothetical protein HNP55_001560 [Paucibacter oligotrophus]|uniref:Uncharacterized protein n=1 Tax=Roseateles oligotrophus TaxID=1769250 RepID=A0A840L5H3_9BURK|nr:hypothetical protein [Roseateles oligotrophus]MBB4843041.1 hypothetical protein [Roseateles oligotrophus]